RRVDEVHLPAALTGLLQARLQLLMQEGGLRAGVLLDRLLGRDRDGPGLAPAQPQAVLEEMADLAEAAADARPLLDDSLGPLGGADRVLAEVFLQGGPVLVQGALGLMPVTLAQARQSALEILVEVALDGAAGDVGECGDPVVGQAVALEPED